MFTQHKDKHAGCNQIGAFRYLALNRPATTQRIVGIWCITDNAIGSKAVHPHTIISTRHVGNESGRISVAIDNTDAEGRLVLADGISFVQDYYHPTRITTSATLTGAIKTALGSYLTGLFTNAPYLLDKLLHIGELNQEPFWLMPLLPENIEDIQGEDGNGGSDIKNMGKKFMGSSNAAAFLDTFIGDGVEFIHWDIAGVSAQPGNPAAGVPVATFQHYLDSLCDEEQHLC